VLQSKDPPRSYTRTNRLHFFRPKNVLKVLRFVHTKVLNVLRLFC